MKHETMVSLKEKKKHETMVSDAHMGPDVFLIPSRKTLTLNNKDFDKFNTRQFPKKKKDG
jgi:hypothetical protein